MDKFVFINDKNFDQLPKTSGVYCFKSGTDIIYIGKAINIKNRVKSHFQQPSYRDSLFIDKVDKIGYLKTNSEIEALILEANLIKKFLPKYNVMWKDDKNYFYVAVRFANGKHEQLPYVFITHQKNYKDAEYIGPFVEGNALKKTLRFLRKAFPYYSVAKHSKNKCTYCHLDLCPGPDPDKKVYQKNIKKLILILQGKRSTVLKSLKKEMRQLAKEKKFEEAAKIRDRIYSLFQVMSHTSVIEPEKNQDFWPKTKSMVEGLLNVKNVSKIECYDVSNMQGKQATGSMVVFVDGKPDKSQYKKFKIKLGDTPNDIAMLKETLERRFSHKEWTFPEVVLIDGGIAQLNIAIKSKPSKNIKIISIAKGKQELFIEGKKNTVPLKLLHQDVYNLIKQLDDEAHRFAITYHKKLRKKNLIG